MSKNKILRQSYTFEDESLYKKVCGIRDSKIKDLENQLKVSIIPRGNFFLISGNTESVKGAIHFFNQLTENFLERPDKQEFESFDVNYLITNQNHSDKTGWSPSDKIFTTYKGKPIYPKTYNQECFTESLQRNQISFAIGPAGTGKTFLSIAKACNLMVNGDVERLVLTRPAVEAGESLGYLPGDLAQKVDPYLRPIYDALYECIGYEKTQDLIAINKIEIAPIAFMRGRTLSNSFIILDEAQNCTIAQLKMILTRLGKNSRMSVSGDITQIDLEKQKSGLEKVVHLCEKIQGIGVVRFSKEDISRHPLVEKLVEAFETIK